LAPDTPTPAVVIPYDALLEHWQGHRRITRRMIQAFPDDALFGFSLGGMRPFSAMALEMIRMASAGMRGLATREWPVVYPKDAPAPGTKAELLRLWDETTDEIEALWPRIPPQRFQEVDRAFGQWEGIVYGLFLYWIDNEIHHRGQGYVYLRALGVEPPAFYDRS
jgi:uncharacterized damage-inducible protein DinB